MSPWTRTADGGDNWFPSPLRSQEQGVLLAEVRRRDGDACRVCCVVVSPEGPRSRYSLNYRILNPGTTLTVAGVVVVCRQHMTTGEVQPAPERPFRANLTSAQRRAAKAAAAVEREKELAAEAADIYDSHQNVAVPLNQINMLVDVCVKNELDGYPVPGSGDPVVTLQEAIHCGAVTVTKGLPAAVEFRRKHPGVLQCSGDNVDARSAS
ncbi:hypothetical protein AAFM46_10860 [Arthrobacter sp. TMP15]|uniref:hypothetical protein n=1 Tax=Arthrobacter sp. TMP15 TaxID=3140789 RepID=UPI0031BA289F